MLCSLDVVVLACILCQFAANLTVEGEAVSFDELQHTNKLSIGKKGDLAWYDHFFHLDMQTVAVLGFLKAVLKTYEEKYAPKKAPAPKTEPDCRSATSRSVSVQHLYHFCCFLQASGNTSAETR